MIQWQKSWMPRKKEKIRFILLKDHEWRNELLHTSRMRVEPQNRDFDVNEFLQSTPNPVVASILGGTKIIQRAVVRRGYPVMRSRFQNFGDDIHDQSVRERITATVQRSPPRLLVLACPSRVWSPTLNYAASPRVRERTER